ncbi:glutamine--fructose-6-phosphate transaminase (isomerizing) [Ponticaulis profundi]|uniref:Glutamine--fructose-6-phosphate aminotransferase [isomerizing] n=1 Tax=Ponticaulis profundi TaxID=2665222 RepID=A0ABW1SE23_9PROT
MCGIIGIVGRYPASPRLVAALKRLEYRGYDSAGIATLSNGELDRRRSEGKIANLESALLSAPLDGTVGIGHTRWATHGPPTTRNAHPHMHDGVAVVHNGIIENYTELRKSLSEKGFAFETDTDTETVPVLLSSLMKEGVSPQDAVRQALKLLRGAYALAILFESHDDMMIGARKGSPLVIGVGEGEMFLGSDALAISPYTKQVIYLEEGDWCVLTKASYTIYNEAGDEVTRPVQEVVTEEDEAGKGNYPHFMLKEIFEQPRTVKRTLDVYTHPAHQTLGLPRAAADQINLADVSSIYMVSCGTAHYATRVSEYWFEQLAGVPSKTDIASEFRYRRPALAKNSIAVFVSQSGETADTLAALRYCKEQGIKTVAIVNVQTSTIAREADVVLPTYAGPEIGVASTKAFTAQLVVLLAFAVAIAEAQGHLDEAEVAALSNDILTVNSAIEKALSLDDVIKKEVIHFEQAADAFYLGRGVYYPLALEGALKLKEISYIHAEGFASGELKHGPIALITAKTPVVFIAPFDDLFEKSLSNLQEVAARSGPVLLLSDEKGIAHAGSAPTRSIALPNTPEIIMPIVQTVALQLLAYHAAVALGTDVDQPRNLAKSVTVE